MMGSLVSVGSSPKERRKRAVEIGAIDGFQLSDDLWALVTEEAIWIEYEETLFERWLSVELDEAVSRPHRAYRKGRGVLRVVRVTDHHTRLRDVFKPRQLHEVTESYSITGKDALERARYARLKLQEYAFARDTTDSHS